MSNTTAGALAVLFSLWLGCGRSATYESESGRVTVKDKAGGSTVEVETKEGRLKMSAGDEGVALPENFPKDVPLYPGASLKATLVQGAQLVVHLEARGSVAEATKFYQGQLMAQGWDIESTMSMGDTGMVTAKKGGRQCAVVASKDGEQTLVQISVSQEKP